MNTNRAVFFLMGGRLPFPTLAVSDFECDRRGYRVEVMAIRVVAFSTGGYKIRKIFA